MKTTYYRFEALDGTRRGLFRVVDDGAGDRYELWVDGGWVERPELARHFLNPDSANEAVPVTADAAASVMAATSLPAA